MRSLRDKRDLEILNQELEGINLNCDYQKKIEDNKVLDVKYLGIIDFENKDTNIYLLLEQKEDKDGKIEEIERYYTEDGFKYIIQIHECAKKNRSKIKVKKWIDTPDLRQYEKFVWDWHQFLLDVQEVFYQTEDTELIRNLNMYVISRFYTKPYEESQDFYAQFYERLKEAKNLLSLGV